MRDVRRETSSPTGELPSLERLLAFFEAKENPDGRHELELAISSKRLTRTRFFDAASWAILVSGFKRTITHTIWEKAVACGFPADWKVLGEWGDDDFDGWCKSMATQLVPPRTDLSGKFRDKWWAIWDLAWYLLQFDTAESFRAHFFDGKSEGRDLTDRDVSRLKEIKDDEGRLSMIGEANRYFVLRNLGGDFLKPDVWIRAFCEWYGDVTVSELAGMLKDCGIRCGRFDAYCWSYCEREVHDTGRLASHFDELFGGGVGVFDDGDVAALEESVWLVEGIRLVVRERGSTRVSTYHYKRAANQDWTLSYLISKRIQPLLADFEVTCIGGDGCEVHGRTLLRTIWTSYGS